MVTEVTNLSVVNPEYSEHSKAGKAKRVIDGPVAPAKDTAGNSALSITSGIPPQALNVEAGKAYRVISDGDFYMKLSKGSSSATSADIYVPASTPITVVMVDGWDHINTQAGPNVGTFVQAIELLS